ncbi:hypothetical protein J7J23_00680 [bacterium]|nr:hypothetical protein [bacterium]
MNLKVLSVTEDKVVIRGGKYEMRFTLKNGKLTFEGFKFLSDRLYENYVPFEYFNPAIKRAAAILHDRKKRRQRKEKQLRLF